MFDTYYEVFIADTEESKTRHFQIRYQVYCEELQYEPVDDPLSRLESDHWDDECVHFIVRHKPSGQWVGAVRLIFPKAHDLSLPIDRHLDTDTIMRRERLNYVEMSRLCIVKEIRRPSVVKSSVATGNELLVYKYHQVIFGLLHAVAEYSFQHGIQYWYFLSKKSLTRLVNQKGFGAVCIGKKQQHRGVRYPYLLDMDNLRHLPLWKNFSASYRLYSEIEITENIAEHRGGWYQN